MPARRVKGVKRFEGSEGTPVITTAEHEVQAREVIQTTVSDLDTILQRQVVLLDWAQKSLSHALTTGFGSKQEGISKGDIEQLTSVTKALEVAVDTQVKLRKHHKTDGRDMTPEQLIAAAVNKIKAMDREERKGILYELNAYHARHQVKRRMTDVEVEAAGSTNAVTSSLASLLDE